MVTKSSIEIRLLLAAVAVVVVSPVKAQTREDLSRLEISATAGIAHVWNAQFNEVYRGVQVPLSVQLDCRVFRRIYAFSGFRFVGIEGEAISEEPVQAQEEFQTKFKMYSAAIGWAVAMPIRRATVTAGAGITCNWYREILAEANLSTRGTAIGFLAQTAARYPLSRRFSVLGRLGFSSIPSRTDPVTNGRINLGGIEVSGGLSVRLF